MPLQATSRVELSCVYESVVEQKKHEFRHDELTRVVIQRCCVAIKFACFIQMLSVL